MLKPLNEYERKLLDLADDIEANTTNYPFDMRQWCDCIAGHAVRKYGQPAFVYDTKHSATRLLGLTDDQATDLFQPRDPLTCGVKELTRKEAAKALRHLAASGEVELV